MCSHSRHTTWSGSVRSRAEISGAGTAGGVTANSGVNGQRESGMGRQGSDCGVCGNVDSRCDDGLVDEHVHDGEDHVRVESRDASDVGGGNCGRGKQERGERRRLTSISSSLSSSASQHHIVAFRVHLASGEYTDGEEDAGDDCGGVGGCGGGGSGGRCLCTGSGGGGQAVSMVAPTD